jgi:hypothetical protein
MVSHTVERLSLVFYVQLPWRKMTEEDIDTGSTNKCGKLQSCDIDVGLFLLASCGGEGEVRTTQ